MQRISLGKSDLSSSRLVYGCMRIAGDNSLDHRERGKRALRAAIEAGYTQFDHADIYGRGACETLFGEVLRESPGLRENLILTGKCGIRESDQPEAGDPKRYDFSYQHIVDSVEASLARLGTEYLDLLLLHRPDYLFGAAEVATAFETLYENGRVRHFGVSNFRTSQVKLLQSQLSRPLLVNQVEINLHNIGALTDGTLDQCQRRKITPQAWCPLGAVAYPAWGNTFNAEDERRIALELRRQSECYEAKAWQVALAWLLRHPAGIQPIIGSTTPSRIRAATHALSLNYRREDWYRLLEARNGQPVA
jgi:predicted oxidoreductase